MGSSKVDGSLKLSRRCLLAIALAAPLGCTPLGLWMYQDPAVTVARVRLVGSDSLALAPVLVALDLQNPNDYPLSAVRVELSLQLDNLPVGTLSQKSSMELPKSTTSTIAFPLTLRAGIQARRLVAFVSGTHRFVVTGRAEFRTPFGKRRVRFAQEGDLKFGEPPLPASAPTAPNG